MANQSILSAFERFWQNTTNVLKGKSDVGHIHDNATQETDGFLSSENKTQLDYGGVPIVTTEGDGSAYTVTVEGITALTVGTRLTIIPHVVSAAVQPTLNVNGLGAKAIRMPVTYNTSTTSVGSIDTWLVKGKPVTVVYNGTYWITSDLPRPSAQYLYGSVPVLNGGTGKDSTNMSEGAFYVTGSGTDEDPWTGNLGALPVANGGTGATTAEDALDNLGITDSDGYLYESLTRPISTETKTNLDIGLLYSYGGYIYIAEPNIEFTGTPYGSNWWINEEGVTNRVDMEHSILGKLTCIQNSNYNVFIEIGLPEGEYSALPTGGAVNFLLMGTGNVTFQAGEGVTIYSKDNKMTLSGQYSMASLISINESEYVLVGALE